MSASSMRIRAQPRFLPGSPDHRVRIDITKILFDRPATTKRKLVSVFRHGPEGVEAMIGWCDKVTGSRRWLVLDWRNAIPGELVVKPGSELYEVKKDAARRWYEERDLEIPEELTGGTSSCPMTERQTIRQTKDVPSGWRKVTTVARQLGRNEAALRRWCDDERKEQEERGEPVQCQKFDGIWHISPLALDKLEQKRKDLNRRRKRREQEIEERKSAAQRLKMRRSE